MKHAHVTVKKKLLDRVTPPFLFIFTPLFFFYSHPRRILYCVNFFSFHFNLFLIQETNTLSISYFWYFFSKIFRVQNFLLKIKKRQGRFPLCKTIIIIIFFLFFSSSSNHCFEEKIFLGTSSFNFALNDTTTVLDTLNTNEFVQTRDFRIYFFFLNRHCA